MGDDLRVELVQSLFDLLIGISPSRHLESVINEQNEIARSSGDCFESLLGHVNSCIVVVGDVTRTF